MAAGVVQIVPYLEANVPAILAIAYLCFAAMGAGFFAGRRGWLAGGLSVVVGAALAGIVCSGLIAGRGGIIAAPSALLFSLFIGSILATQLHQAFRPQSPPIEEFNALISLRSRKSSHRSRSRS